MNPPNKQIPKNRGKIVLPFEKKKKDAGTWAYDHQVGLCITVIAYLLIGIAFMTGKIILNKNPYANAILIEMPQEKEEVKTPELTPEERKQLEADLQNVKNEVSNENSKNIVDRQTARNLVSKDIAKTQEAVDGRLKSNREAYERGLKEEADIRNSAKSQPESTTDNTKKEDAQVRGSVAVSYSLEGRTAVYLHRPSYQCEGGGQVIVAITVNQSGNVTAAEIKSSSTNEECLLDRAVQSAKKSRFNISASVPAKQQGTITYLFVPQ